MSAHNILAECYFLDVAQGTSNVILLGERRAIVIDCGPSARVPLLLLRRYVDQIVALIVSHNDRDHHGGASGIIAAYPRAIDQVYFLQDRPVEHISLYGVVKRAHEHGKLPAEPIRLECDDRPRVLYADPAKQLSIELMFPTFQDNLDAQIASRANKTSGVLVFFCGQRKIVFPGDSTMDDWQRIRHRLGARIDADILAVPHHGGNVVGPRRRSESSLAYDARIRNELQSLYSDAVLCRYAIVSVGTSNNYGHPKASSIAALRNCGSHVLCTQITTRCHEELEQLRPGVIRPLFPSQSQSRQDITTRGRSRNVACAGTVISEVGAEEVVIQRVDEHHSRVDDLVKAAPGHPLCR